MIFILLDGAGVIFLSELPGVIVFPKRTVSGDGKVQLETGGSDNSSTVLCEIPSCQTGGHYVQDTVNRTKKTFFDTDLRTLYLKGLIGKRQLEGIISLST